MAEYIEREALLNDLENSIVISCKTENIPQVQRVLSKIINCIKDHPTADAAEVRHGEWLKNCSKMECSECGYFYFSDNVKTNYEELNELYEAVTEYQANKSEANLTHLIEEMADVEIMLRQIKSVASDKVDEFVQYKLNRQLKRIEDEN